MGYMRKVDHWPRQRGVKELIIEMLESNESIEDISEELGVGIGEIRKIKKELQEKRGRNDEDEEAM